ncbi:MAG: neutral/alkaline non-lysosomal ceramidase N-terminal domain-containing protein [candidate division KSB1 bacterium]|nr:neutral/alkaline non-lysosomal ceramidase N-terminal domain-containing protein [candidate division KSB1 bacterium]
MTILKAGLAKVDITPPAGLDLSGYVLREGKAIGVKDPLFTRAVVFDNGKNRVAMIVCDLLGFRDTDVEICRKELQARCGLDRHQIMIAATHTHSAPATLPLIGCGEVEPAYVKVLREKIVQAVAEAAQQMRPVYLTTGRTTLTIGLNRRGNLAKGSMESTQNSKGPVDPELIVTRISDDEGKIVGAMVNYGCHATTLGPDNLYISGDYSGYGMNLVERHFGSDMVTLFTNGGGADVNPAPRGNYDYVEQHGQALAEKVLALMEQMPDKNPGGFKESKNNLESELLSLKLEYEPIPSLEQCECLIQEYEEKLSQGVSGNQEITRIEKITKAFLTWAQSLKNKLISGGLEKEKKIEIQKMVIGDLAVIGLPFEVFARTALVIKSASSYPMTFVVGYSNGDYGYLPPEEEFGNGGYEVNEAYKFYHQPAAFSRWAEGKVRRECVKLLRGGSQYYWK